MFSQFQILEDQQKDTTPHDTRRSIMKISPITRCVLLALLAESGNAFSVAPHRTAARVTSVPGNFQSAPMRTLPAPLYASAETTSEVNEDIQRLKSMAAKLRAEAAELEAKKAQERADLADKAFKKFDQNNDGEISLDELKAALEKTFKIEIPERRVEKLMDNFDQSGDGKLQKDEFVGIEQFRNKLDTLVREEKEKALAATKAAKEEAELAKVMEAQLELINDKPPSNTDKIVSVLPYLWPLLDGLMFGRFLLENADNNPVVTSLAVLYTIYRSIPLSGFLSFFALNVLSGNLSINKLVRFNMQQAIFLDIALFAPGLIAAVASAASSGLNLQIPPGIGELSSDVVFFTLLAAIGYSTVSSLTGNTPDKLPFISDAVKNRVPSIEDFLDEDGRFDTSLIRKNVDADKKSDDDKNDD
jgi:hypothetical protein